jgi:hypothetical protein
MARFKIDRMTPDLQVKIRDCRVLVDPFLLCTPNAVAATWIFEGGVSNPTRHTLYAGVIDLSSCLQLAYKAAYCEP